MFVAHGMEYNRKSALRKLMKGLTCTFVVVLSLQAFAMKPEFFYLKVTSVDSEVKCFLNGFPVYELRSEGEVTNQIPVNVYLAGRKNELKIWMKPLDGPAKVVVSAYLYDDSDVVSTDDAQPGRKEFVVESSGEPKEQVFHFDSGKFDFSEVFLDAPVIAMGPELNTYAAALLKMIGGTDVKGLLAEMNPKVRDYALAFSAPEEVLRTSLEEQLSMFLSDEKLVKPIPEEITWTSYCEGRVWALRGSSGRALLYIDDGNDQSLEIYVALVDGKLGIVR